MYPISSAHKKRKRDEGVVDVESSVRSGSEYQSSSLKENRPRLDQSQGFRSSESGERRRQQGENTSLTGNKSGRIEQQVNKRKRIRGSRESLIGFRQQQYKKTKQESVDVIFHIHQASYKKRVREAKDNFGQVPAEDLRSESEQKSLQSSRIQQGRSSPYNLRRRRDVTKEAGSRLSGRVVQPQGRLVRSRREPFSRPNPDFSNQHRESKPRGRQ
ncbi:hypothetical protein TNCV_1803211 [Trichonephila clavipes]|uniref:Uncharacterized protein n=1 Tax=Trichonephila clavipes TaxID=2585209 RepID=A0A8X6SKY9_TRICX|nr:hypothetical protein TNCV_1803211 [Trichonephila clavipes]